MENQHVIKEIVKKIVGSDIFIDESLAPSQFINKYWEIYNSQHQSNPSINGGVLEELIAMTLIRKGIFPFYMQARVAFIPNVNYDFIVYTKDLGPISISSKTSLRERYKQADLEAVALKYIHRNSKSFLVTLNSEECNRRKKDIGSLMAINDIVLATSKDFDEMLDFIKENTVSLAPKVEVVTSNSVITADNYKTRYL